MGLGLIGVQLEDSIEGRVGIALRPLRVVLHLLGVEVLPPPQEPQRHIVQEDLERLEKGVGYRFVPQHVHEGAPGPGLGVDRLLAPGPFLGGARLRSDDLERHQNQKRERNTHGHLAAASSREQSTKAKGNRMASLNDWWLGIYAAGEAATRVLR